MLSSRIIGATRHSPCLSRGKATIPSVPRVGARSFVTSPIQAGHIQEPLPHESHGKKRERFREFDLQGKVFAVTGGARGLGLSMAEALVEAGGRGN